MLALRKILTHFVSTAHIIAYAHQRSDVHCDLKPQNILLGAFGETYVIDWGLAAVVDPGNFAELAEQRGLCGAGTQGYCHPEQLAGTAPPNRAWDIYSLGAVLYKLLANRVAGESQSPSLDSRNPKGKAIRRPRAVDKTIPAALESICLRTLGNDKSRVYERAKWPTTSNATWRVNRCQDIRRLRPKKCFAGSEATKAPPKWPACCCWL